MSGYHPNPSGWDSPPRNGREQERQRPADNLGQYDARGTFRSDEQGRGQAPPLSSSEGTKNERSNEPPTVDEADSDDDSDEEIRRRELELKRLRKERAARKAQKQGVASGTAGEDRTVSRVSAVSTHLGSNIQPIPGQQPKIQGKQGTGLPETQSIRHEESFKYYQGQRLSSSAFSPGYGFRAPHPGSDHLPKPEELVTSEGAVHRVYPAPAPLCPPANADEGWEEDKTMTENPASTTPSPSIEVVLHKASTLQMPRQVSPPLSPPLRAPVTPSHWEQQQVRAPVRITDPTERDAPPHMSSKSRLTPTSPGSPAPTTGKTAYVAWPSEGVQVTDPGKAMDELARLFEQRLLRPTLAPRQGDGPFQGRRPPADQGYPGPTDRGVYGGTSNDEHVSEPQNDGWASQPSRGEGGYGSGQQGSDGCRKCGEPGHFARECPQASRPAPAIHPSRLGLIGSGPISSRPSQVSSRSEHDDVPNDGKRRDGGWSLRAQPSYQSGPVPRREPSPLPAAPQPAASVPEVRRSVPSLSARDVSLTSSFIQDEYGGW
ncbi:hypothetical protein IAU59_002168 [Kwoniella sp. CBS 9459]